ncbi:hypothetical protein BU24DRAFT_415764 [Aaosphaeria arxii CBS 175.79]|uniref:Uncharacterized protein n=1 Tax=Aaosphaeria arxii CBS 175.79 TaxID=1450172 RepID=A0A6A5X721_9PLEO|nr:uncharacterized protein BU24DRAFT_415764 [Aaosphaeria arxii CBS 175.79]KAF2008710.1 hypothetical protein BU24DRAFT_415764 [Aaosphaeria arxii CBS 175.79]
MQELRGALCLADRTPNSEKIPQLRIRALVLRLFLSQPDAFPIDYIVVVCSCNILYLYIWSDTRTTVLNAVTLGSKFCFDSTSVSTSKKGEEKKVIKTRPYQAQAYLTLLSLEHIQQRVWMKEQNGKRIDEFEDMTGYDSFRFDMQTKSTRDDGHYYCIQMQSNRESKSRSVSGKPKSHSYCDVQIHENATPSPTVFLDACWSSAAQNDKQTPGTSKPKTMTVIIRADNTWINLDTSEVGYDEEAEMQSKKKDVDELMAKIWSNTATSEDYKRFHDMKKKRVA